MIALLFTGSDGLVRFGDRPIKHGETMTLPDDLALELLKRSDFRRIDETPFVAAQPEEAED